ncbi:3'-5'-exoribonuclease [Mycoemilia scoparia]|uniref:Exosome complex component RRP45 n=1 Tax=Mycoemilia scoparia TaxID=417184 RepID=A0A9W8A3T3_9FUNG|nr:3'-5'-exoribonuclease [Mycoemilia scoparia]
MGQENKISNNNREFLLSALKSGTRVDGRGIYDYRTLRIEFGETSGTVYTYLGNTKVLVKISSQVVRPYVDRPTEGIVQFNTEIATLASPVFDAGKPTQMEVNISRTIEKVFHRNRVVDTESLCILANRKVWNIRVDVHFLDYDGNMLDAACIGIVAALKTFKRPDVTVDGEEAIIHSILDKPPVPLSINYAPICVTFGFFEDGEYMILDPGSLEEQVQTASLTMALNNQSEVCTINKAGGIPLSLDQVLRCIKIATAKIEEIHSIINEAVASQKK